jgi:hypothetical protein
MGADGVDGVGFFTRGRTGIAGKKLIFSPKTKKKNFIRCPFQNSGMRKIPGFFALIIIGLVMIAGCANRPQSGSQTFVNVTAPAETHGLSNFTSCKSPERWIQLSFPEEGIPPDTAQSVRDILLYRLNVSKAQCGAVSLIPNNEKNVTSARVEFSGLDPETAKLIIGKPGRFELKIETNASLYERILTNEDVSRAVFHPIQSLPGHYFLSIEFTDEGAKKLQRELKKYGATEDPDHHKLSEIVDGDVYFTGPLSSDFAVREEKEPYLTNLAMPVDSAEEAVQLAARLSKGPLPVDVNIVGSGSFSN